MRTWQCDVCGTTYRVAWLSHCYRCEALPKSRPPKVAKPSKPRRGRMPRIVAGVGPSNADEVTEQAALVQPEPELVEPEDVEVPAEASEPEPAAPPAEPEPAPPVAEPAPEPVVAPAPVVDAPVAAPKGGAA